MQAIEFALAGVGRRLDEFERILDFGCGPGRILRHMGAVAESCQLHGVDIDSEMVEWCAENIPFATFVTGPHDPPLPYDEASFDLIFNHSVFTHMDERRQDQWLAELKRILVPGGLALLTVHSPRQAHQVFRDFANGGQDPEPFRDELERRGILFIREDGFIGSTHPDWYHSTFHAPWYIHEHWTQFFALRAYLPEGSHDQDFVVLEKRVDEDPHLRAIGRRLDQMPVPVAPTAPAAPTAPPRAPARFTVRGLLEGLWQRAAPSTSADLTQATLAALSDQVDELRAALASLPDARTHELMRQSLYAQAERITMVERELRSQLVELESQLDAPAASARSAAGRR